MTEQERLRAAQKTNAERLNEKNDFVNQRVTDQRMNEPDGPVDARRHDQKLAYQQANDQQRANDPVEGGRLMTHKLTVVHNKPEEEAPRPGADEDFNPGPPVAVAAPFHERLATHLGRIPAFNEELGHYFIHLKESSEAEHLKQHLSQVFGKEATVDVQYADAGGPIEDGQHISLPIVIASATTSNPVNFKANHNFALKSSHTVSVSGGMGNWSAVNGEHEVTVLSQDVFSIPVDSTRFGAVTGDLVFHTIANGGSQGDRNEKRYKE